MKTSLLILSCIFVGWVFVVGFIVPSDQNNDQAVKAGKALYTKYCSTCHGDEGKGDGTAEVYLFPKPRDFTSGIFKFQSTTVGSLPTDDDLKRIITMGMPGSAMPSWDRFTDTDINNLIDYIKSFSERFKSEIPSGAITIGYEPQSSPREIQNGKAIYALMSCWSCHGKTGAGDGPSASDLNDDAGWPIRPYNFSRAGAFKGGGQPRDIYRTFSTGIGGTPMPGYGEDALALTRESYADLTILEGQFTAEEMRDVQNFVSMLPTEADLDAMSPERRIALAAERRWSLVFYTLSLNTSGKTQIGYTTKDHALTSMIIDDVEKFSDPLSGGWTNVSTVELPLISLWQRDTPTDRVLVKSITDGQSLVIRLEWEDETKDDGAVYNAKFGDAAAVQFPIDPTSDPFFAMGDTNFVVNIWHWKSWWEKDMKKYQGVTDAFPNSIGDGYLFDVSGGSLVQHFVSTDSARKLSMPWNAGWGSGNLQSTQTRTSPVEDLNAKGFGTLTSQPMNNQNVNGKGIWKDGKWSLVVVRSLDSKERDDVMLKQGMTIPVAFAVWDGSQNDRNGQKMVTNWYRLTIGKR